VVAKGAAKRKAQRVHPGVGSAARPGTGEDRAGEGARPPENDRCGASGQADEGGIVVEKRQICQTAAQSAGEKLVIEALKSLPSGQGLTMAEIVQKTGVQHSTVYRTLSNEKRNKGR
jgi:hypothetical protein